MKAAFQRASRSRADLVRLFAHVSQDERAQAASTLGFVREQDPVREIEISTAALNVPLVENETGVQVLDEPSVPAPIVEMPLWRFEGMTFHDEPERSEPTRESVQGLTAEDVHGTGRSLFALPRATPLAPWSKLWPRLRQSLHATVPSREPDVAKWVRRVSQGEIVERIPRLARKAWPSRLSIWVDRSRRLVPFWGDQVEVCRHLHKVCDRYGITVRWLDARTQAMSMSRRGDFLENVRLDNQWPVLVLGDLGWLGSDADRAAWRKTALRAKRFDVRLSALVPVCPARWTLGLSRLWHATAWEHGRLRMGMGLARHAGAWSDRAERLLRIVSPSAYTQPGLLRALRLLLPPAHADASTEADVWNHADVRAADAAGMVLQPEAAEQWRNAFAATDDTDLKERVSRVIADWHKPLPRELLRAETLVWLSVAPNVDAPGDVQDALDFAARLEGSALASGDDPRWADVVKRYGHALLAGMPAAVYERIPALQTVWVASFQGVAAPRGIDPVGIRAKLEKAGETRHWWVRQVGAKWVFGLNERGTEWPSYVTGPGSPLVWFEASRPWVTVARGQTVEEHRLEPGLELWFDLDEPVELRTDRSTVRMAPWVRESWVEAAGRDRFGLWADARIHGVVQRFRWIPPGRFLMGSPRTEEGRFEHEGPEHYVTWTGGRWLGDTPVTQGLWRAVKGSNPSLFQSKKCSTDNRPVEQVSYEDSVEFSEWLDMRLPFEAEWEHACRAGTTTGTWLGELVILGKNNAPVLDAIAWYGGNCGVEYDIDRGHDVLEFEDKQYEFAQGGTRVVRMKTPNPFGLYDMLGNVHEWCWDTHAPYTKDERRDPEPVEEGALHVLRGSSWSNFASDLRAAFRDADDSNARLGTVGFRLARDTDTDPLRNRWSR